MGVREAMLQRCIRLLGARGFEVTPFLHSNTCFDLVARNPGAMLLVKVFENIDSLRPEQAAELRKLESVFNANALVVGAKTKAFRLERGRVYDRYGVPVVSVETFGDLLAEKVPYVKYFKGRNIVELDAEQLKAKRVERGLSLGEVAEHLHVSRETVYRFESGSTTSLETGQKLEKFFSCKLIKSPPLFSGERKPLEEGELFPEDFEDELLQRVHELGCRLAVFRHAPFDALTQSAASARDAADYLIGIGAYRAAVANKARRLGKSSSAFSSRSFIVARDATQPVVSGTPVLSLEDLKTLSSERDLLELVRERERKKIR